MAKKRNKPAPAATETKPDVTPEPTPAAGDAPTPPVPAEGADVTNDTPPAAPAATDASPESAEAPAELAGPAAPPTGDETSAPPASADAPQDGPPEAVEQHPPLPGSMDVSVQTDQSQEILDKLAEERQPEIPVLDRVLSRLAATITDPHKGYASTSPEVSLPGDLAEVNAKLFDAMLAEGVPCSRQGDTLRFLLEELRGTIRRGF